MANLGRVILVLSAYALAFLAFGSLVTAGERRREFSFSRTLLAGFFLYHAVFQVIALPFMFLQKTLSLLAAFWGAAAAAVILWSAWRSGRLWVRTAGERLRGLFGKDRWGWAALLLTGVLVLVSSLIYVSFWDATYYVGQVSFSVYTDTINQIDPLSGRFLESFDLKHCLATYHVNDAVICRLFGIHPLIETKTVMVIAVMILTSLVYYRIGLKLFHGRKSSVTIFLFFVFVLHLWTYSAYTGAGFLLFRTYEGKAVTANLSIPAILCLLLDLYGGRESRQTWMFLLITVWGAAAIASSAMFLLPAMLAAGLIPLAAIRRQPAVLGRMVLVMLPCLAAAACYLLWHVGVLEIAVRR